MPYLFHLLFLLAFAVFMFGCGDNKPSRGLPKSSTCSPYYLADFNDVVLADRTKNGYSKHLFELCENFKLKYGFSTECIGFGRESKVNEIARGKSIGAICNRNNRQQLSFKAAQPQLIRVIQKPEIIQLKFMVMDPLIFNNVRESTRNFDNREVFSEGTSRNLRDVTQDGPASYCLFSSSAPLRENDVFDILSMGRDKSANTVISAVTKRDEIYVSFVCVDKSGGDEAPQELLRRHLGRTAVIN